MPDLSVVLREAFPLGAAGPTVRRWWPPVLTGLVAVFTVWAATVPWFGAKVGQIGLPYGFTGTGRTELVGRAAGTAESVRTDGMIPLGYVTAGLAIAALVLVFVAAVRPAVGVRCRSIASALLGIAAGLSIVVWMAPGMVLGDLADAVQEQTAASASGYALSFVPNAGLVWTIVLTSVGATMLFMGRRNRSLNVAAAAAR
ncbi:hypothetical protein [Tsukamurella pseudospumae]|uniref:Uncharacterized protein n=1 Tax=Tsukamurella pseudospumae TaxID=239498 RepID=A0A138AXI4_9ACTN|nr:hypothetical protein [Tsukamurella pseudospumae]KXP15150.1 hypothetical protein AXK60_04675 [Tsukamurella pseudospumae]